MREEERRRTKKKNNEEECHRKKKEKVGSKSRQTSKDLGDLKINITDDITRNKHIFNRICMQISKKL